MNSDTLSNPAADSVSEYNSDAQEFVQKNFSLTSMAELNELSEIKPESERNSTVSWRELVAIPAAVVLIDRTLYHGDGFSRIAVMLFDWVILLWFAASKPLVSVKTLLIFAAVFATSLKLVWCGFWETAILGFTLLFLFGLVQAGRRFSFVEIADYLSQTIFGGACGLADYLQFFAKRGVRLPMGTWLAVGLPLLTVAIFGTIFVMANPSLIEIARRLSDRIFECFFNVSDYLPAWTQILCWFSTAWVLSGMVRPLQNVFTSWDSAWKSIETEFELNKKQPASETNRLTTYFGYRNTLFSVIVLFAVYLVFEFKTLWFRDFPEGFCYSDYSHHGAAWLVVALTLSTIVLSLIFKPEMYCDPRIGTLRRLAGVWSVLNFVLALAVYNRLFLYINFNGMTRMRVVGLLGTTAVLIGFVLVVRKIMKQKSFGWLLQRFFVTVFVMIFLDLVLPVDWLVHRYNVAKILKGDYAPAVQISVHPCSSEGYLTFLPLATDCKDEIIRNGIRALLSKKYVSLSIQHLETSPSEGKYAWTRFQLADEILFRQLDANRNIFDCSLESDSSLQHDIDRFNDYVYRWY